LHALLQNPTRFYSLLIIRFLYTQNSAKQQDLKGTANRLPRILRVADNIYYLYLKMNSARHRRLHNPINPSSQSLRSLLDPSLKYETNNFERDPRSALMIMAINMGLARFNGVSDISKEDRVTVDIHDVPTKTIINNIIKAIETNFSPSTRGEKYRSQIDSSSDLIGFASCGIRVF
jgi:hypothetical protein